MKLGNWLNAVAVRLEGRSMVTSSRRQRGRVQEKDLAAHVDWLEDRALLSVTWVEQGPGPITGGQVLGLSSQGNPVAGAVQTIAAHPSNADVMLVGTIQGGIWKTTNATSSNPTWTPRTDFAKTLSILDLAYSPIDPQIVYAGTGSFSNGFGDAPAAGVLRSINGGDTWQQLAQIDTVAYRIRAIVPTVEVVNGNQVLYAGAIQPNNRAALNTSIGGVYRSQDGGATWQKVLSGAVSDIKVDTRDTTGRTLFCVQPGVGVSRTTDGGTTWNPLNGVGFTSTPIPNSILSQSINARLSISNTSSGWQIAVGFVGPPVPAGGGSGAASGVFVSSNPVDDGWSSIGVPADVIGNINIGNQGNRNFTIAAHPTLAGAYYRLIAKPWG